MAVSGLERADVPFAPGAEVPFAIGIRAGVPVVIPAQGQHLFGLRLKVPGNARRGSTLRLDLVQRAAQGDRIMGGIAVQINVL